MLAKFFKQRPLHYDESYLVIFNNTRRQPKKKAIFVKKLQIFLFFWGESKDNGKSTFKATLRLLTDG